jgi:hypothetical protein
VNLSGAMAQVVAVREENKDVFVWPNVEWTALYTIEELTEFMRFVQFQEQPEHLRGNKMPPSLADAHTEWGQCLMMLLTLGHQMGINPDKALIFALNKISTRSEEERARRREAHRPD